MVNKENIQSVEKDRGGERRRESKKKKEKKKVKHNKYLKQKTLNQEIYSLDFKEFELMST